ncbi:hypothetical protein L6452_15829 [Arctium lappa]|uniref:Uncharacterized protein n=1 Tax=Arctium lappa TaxID=4217 RepID=A0ACB9CPU8_ARCLA|nr:hypothetical protein L6452_15829 [Arctium lappa]
MLRTETVAAKKFLGPLKQRFLLCGLQRRKNGIFFRFFFFFGSILKIKIKWIDDMWDKYWCLLVCLFSLLGKSKKQFVYIRV